MRADEAERPQETRTEHCRSQQSRKNLSSSFLHEARNISLSVNVFRDLGMSDDAIVCYFGRYDI